MKAPWVEAEKLVGETLGQPAERLVDAALERRERESDLFPAQTLVIPEKLLSWLAEFYQHAHGWSQLCSHGRQFTRPRQRNGLAHSLMESGSAIARGGNGSWPLQRRLRNSLAR
jgi:hypothetical protein